MVTGDPYAFMPLLNPEATPQESSGMANPGARQGKCLVQSPAGDLLCALKVRWSGSLLVGAFGFGQLWSFASG